MTQLPRTLRKHTALLYAEATKALQDHKPIADAARARYAKTSRAHQTALELLEPWETYIHRTYPGTYAWTLTDYYSAEPGEFGRRLNLKLQQVPQALRPPLRIRYARVHHLCHARAAARKAMNDATDRELELHRYRDQAAQDLEI